jgi:hypothetical protein
MTRIERKGKSGKEKVKTLEAVMHFNPHPPPPSPSWRRGADILEAPLLAILGGWERGLG